MFNRAYYTKSRLEKQRFIRPVFRLPNCLSFGFVLQ